MTVRRSFPSFLLGAALLFTASFAARAALADDPAPAKPADEPAGPDAKARAEVVRIVDELRTEASKIRGLEWKAKVEADLLTRAQLMQRLEQMIKEELDPKEYERDLKVARRLGLLTAEQDPIELSKRFLALGIAGYFDPKTKKLYLIDGLTGDAQRPSILHELTHALEDQYIDLDKSQEAIKKDQDRTFAFKCVIEGSAETARALYEKEHPDVARLSQKEQLKSANQAELSKVLKETPSFLLLPILLNYQVGPAFVGRYIKGKAEGSAGETTTQQDYVAGMAKLYADQPTTEEQVMHPGKFVGANRDLPRKVTWPEDLAAAAGEGWAALERDPFGELDTELWLDRWLGGNEGKLDLTVMATGRYFSDAARVAAEGWDGAWLQVLEMKGDPRAYAFASAWDTPKDAVEAGDALLAAAKKRYGDKFKSGDWVEKDGVRTSNFEGAYGLARIEVKGDEVRVVDGLPLEALDRVFASLEKATFEKDPKDTWTAENAPDLTSGAAWRNEKAGIAWKKPGAGWSVEAQGDSKAVFKKDALEIQVRVTTQGLMEMAKEEMLGLAGRYPGFNVMSPPISEATVMGKEAVKFDFESAVKGAAEDAPKQHVVELLVLLGDKSLIVKTATPVDAWAAAAKDFDAAVAGFVARE